MIREKLIDISIMKAELKAKELIEKFMPYVHHTTIFRETILNAKQCALIACDEIIDALFEYDETTEKHLKKEFPNYFSCEVQNMDSDFRYWQEVKKHINEM